MLEIIDNRTLTEDAKVKLFTMALHKYQVTKDRLNWTEPMVVQLRDDSFAPAPTISDEMTASDLQLRENAEVNREIAGAPTPPLPTVARGKTGRKPSAKRSPAVAEPIAARKRPRTSVETETEAASEPAPKKIRQDYLERLLGESPVLGPKRVIATAVFPILFF